MGLLWLPRLIGTAQSYFRLGKAGPRLKDNSGALAVRNAGDSGNAAMAAASLTLDTPLAENHGGTGKNSYAVGDLLYASGTQALSKLAGNTTTTKKFLSQTGNGNASAAPAWGSLAAADIPNLDWSKITAGKPTTLAGYGITNAAATDSIPTFAGGVSGAEGGEIHLAKPASGTSLTSDVVIDASANNVRFFGTIGGSGHGVFVDLAGCSGINLLWHNGNDGAGSGLDADLLDGQHGSYYAPIAGPHFIGPLSVGGPGQVTPSGALASAYGSIALGDSDTGFRAVTDGVLEFWCNNVATAASWADHWEIPVGVTIGGWGTPIGIAALYVPGWATRTAQSPYYWLAVTGTGYFYGNPGSIPVSIYASGRILAPEFNAFSDIRLKENIRPIDARRGLEFIQKVEPVMFNWKDLPDEPGTKFGYIAQQVIKAGFSELIGFTENKDLPELIDNDGLVSAAGVQLTLCYEQAIPLHTAALKGLLERIEGLEQRIAVLEAERDDGK